MIHIIIPIHNRISHTRHCLESLVKQKGVEFRIVIVDDGSTDDSSRVIRREFGDSLEIEILSGDGDLFWGGAVEKGMKHVLAGASDDDLLMTLNNDVILDADYFRKVTDVLSKHPDSLIGGVSLDDRGNVRVTGWLMRSWPLALTERVWWPMSLEELSHRDEEVIDVDFLPGTAVMAPVSLVRRVGPVSGSQLRHYHADSEFSWRVKRNGYRVLVGRDLIICHDLEATGTTSGFRRISPSTLLQSFFTVRSGNCLLYKIRFARLCCPAHWRAFFLVADTMKVLVKGIAACFSESLAMKLKAATNHLGRA